MGCKGLFLPTTRNPIYGKALLIGNRHAGFVIGVEFACQAQARNRWVNSVFRWGFTVARGAAELWFRVSVRTGRDAAPRHRAAALYAPIWETIADSFCPKTPLLGSKQVARALPGVKNPSIAFPDTLDAFCWAISVITELQRLIDVSAKGFLGKSSSLLPRGWLLCFCCLWEVLGSSRAEHHLHPIVNPANNPRPTPSSNL